MGNPMLGQLTVLRSLVTFAADAVCITSTKINWQWCSLKKHMIWYALSLSSVVWVIWLKQSEWSKVNTRASRNRENSIWNYSRQAYIRSVKVGTGEVKINQDWPRFAKIVESEAEGDDGEVVSLWWSEEVRVGPTKFYITRPQLYSKIWWEIFLYSQPYLVYVYFLKNLIIRNCRPQTPNRRDLKNHAECTSQSVKRTSGTRVKIKYAP